MNFFGVGLPEMMLIFAVALLVFGPKKLPEISRSIAKVMKSLQDASRDFQTEFNREASELERVTRIQQATALQEEVKTPSPIPDPLEGESVSS